MTDTTSKGMPPNEKSLGDQTVILPLLKPAIIRPLNGKRYTQIPELTAETGLTSWTTAGIKKGIFVNNQLVGPSHVNRYPPHTTYITGETIEDLKLYYGYITGNVHGFFNSTIVASGADIYISTKVRYVFKVLGAAKPTVVWEQVTIEGDDTGTKFCIVTYSNSSDPIFDPVQVTPI